MDTIVDEAATLTGEAATFTEDDLVCRRAIAGDLTAEPSDLGSAETGDVSTVELVYRPMPFWKRAGDVVGAALLIVLLLPVFVGISIYIRVTSKGPALFKQTRLGSMGNHFTIYKFRTLHLSSDSHEVTSEHRDYINNLTSVDKAIRKPDVTERLIAGGSFLRASSLDELPQLLNVLLGNMSLVGPRPDVLDWEDYPAWQLRRFEVIPGMTGLWQVSGKNQLTYSQMVELDLQYIEQRSPWLDLRILYRTIAVVLSGNND